MTRSNGSGKKREPKTPATFETHQNLGRMIAGMIVTAEAVEEIVEARLPRFEQEAVSRMVSALDRARAILDDALVADFPDQAGYVSPIYYPLSKPPGPLPEGPAGDGESIASNPQPGGGRVKVPT